MPRFEFRDRYTGGRLMGCRVEYDGGRTLGYGDGKYEFATIFDALEVASLHPSKGGVFPSIDNIEFFGHDMTGVPTVESLDQAVLAAISGDGALLLKDRWHDGDRHDRGGWVIHLAGDDGYDLEERYGPKVAASPIYAASCPGLSIPIWFLYGDVAMADLERRAAAWAAGPPYPDIPWFAMRPEPFPPGAWPMSKVAVEGKKTTRKERVRALANA